MASSSTAAAASTASVVPHSVRVPMLTVFPLSGYPWAYVSASPRRLCSLPHGAEVAFGHLGAKTFMQTGFLPYGDIGQARQGKGRLGQTCLHSFFGGTKVYT